MIKVTSNNKTLPPSVEGVTLLEGGKTVTGVTGTASGEATGASTGAASGVAEGLATGATGVAESKTGVGSPVGDQNGDCGHLLGHLPANIAPWTPSTATPTVLNASVSAVGSFKKAKTASKPFATVTSN